MLVRVAANGAQQVEPVARFDQAQNRWVTIPLEFGTGEQLILVLFATGGRNLGAQSNAVVTVGGVTADLQFIGPQGSLVGVDQVNAGLPRALAGRGEVEVVLTVGGQASNAVKVNFK